MNHIDMFEVAIAIGVLLVSGAALVAAYWSAEAAKRSAKAAMETASYVKKQNEIALLEKRFKIQGALEKYIHILISQPWDFNEFYYDEYEGGILDGYLYFPREINNRFADIRLHTENYLGQRDEIDLTEDASEKERKIRAIRAMKNNLRQLCIETNAEIRAYLRSGITDTDS